jgi:hypothetical protein
MTIKNEELMYVPKKTCKLCPYFRLREQFKTVVCVFRSLKLLRGRGVMFFWQYACRIYGVLCVY